jgi:hypothetical protein
MSTTRTANIKLRKPAPGDPGWAVPVNANADTLDGLGPLRNFAVTPAGFNAAETPQGRTISVAPGDYVAADGSRRSVAAATILVAAPSATTCVWLDADGTIGSGAAYPTSGRYAPLARVAADATNITGIVDDRAPTSLLGGGLPFAGLSMDITSVDYPATRYAATTSDSVIEVNSGSGPDSIRAVAIDLPIVVGTVGRIVVVINAGFGTVPITVQDQATVTLPWLGSVAWLLFEGDEVWTPLTPKPVQMLNVRTIAADEPHGVGLQLNSDLTRVDCTAGPVAVTLSTAINYANKALTFKKVDASGNAATILAWSGEHIDGSASVTLASQYDVVRLVSNGTSWDVI